MLFGEKYPDPVRVVSMGDFIRELCGATHVDNTSQIGRFEIISEEGVAAGTRRITALTGKKASLHAEQVVRELEQVAASLGVSAIDVPEAAAQRASQVRDLKKRIASGAELPQPQAEPEKSVSVPSDIDYLATRAALRETARLLNVGLFDVASRLDALNQEIEQLREQLEKLQTRDIVSADGLLELAEEFDGTSGIIQFVQDSNADILRRLIDQLRQKMDSAAILLATAIEDDKVVLVAGVTPDLVERGVHAGNWVSETARVVGGGGGGRPDMAQAGGRDPAKLDDALQLARQQLGQMLG